MKKILKVIGSENYSVLELDLTKKQIIFLEKICSKINELAKHDICRPEMTLE